MKGVAEVVKGWVRDVASRGQPPSTSGRDKKKRKANPKRRRASPSSSATTSPFPSPSKPKEKRKPLQPIPIKQPNLPRRSPTAAPGSSKTAQPPARPSYNTRLTNRGPLVNRARTPTTQPLSPQNVDIFSPGPPASLPSTNTQPSDSQVTLVFSGDLLSNSQAAGSPTQASHSFASGSQVLQPVTPAFQASQLKASQLKASPVPPPHAAHINWALLPYHPAYNPVGLPTPDAAAYWQRWEWQQQVPLNGRQAP